MRKLLKVVVALVALYALGLLCANGATAFAQNGQAASKARMTLASGEGQQHEPGSNESGEGGEEQELGHAKVTELPNLIGVIHELSHGTALQQGIDKIALTPWGPLGTLNDPMGDPVTALETVLFGFFVVIILCIFFIVARGRIKVKPPKPGQGRLSRLAMFCEIIVVFFEDFFGAIVGKENIRRHLPLIGTLFIYIFVCNNIGLLWLGKAPTANLSFNLALSLVVFLYVHFVSMSKSFIGYLKHFPGDYPQPKTLGLGPAGFLLSAFIAILFTIIHIMEFAIQPISLSLRLYGNLLGKEVLLGVFGSTWPLIPGIVQLPLHTPFLFLGLLLGTIQALIFSLLTAVYITLWEPHVHHEHDHEHGHGQEGHGAAHAGAH